MSKNGGRDGQPDDIHFSGRKPPKVVLGRDGERGHVDDHDPSTDQTVDLGGDDTNPNVGQDRDPGNDLGGEDDRFGAAFCPGEERKQGEDQVELGVENRSKVSKKEIREEI